MQFIKSLSGDRDRPPVIPGVRLLWPQGASVHKDVYLGTNNKIGFPTLNQSQKQLELTRGHPELLDII